MRPDLNFIAPSRFRLQVSQPICLSDIVGIDRFHWIVFFAIEVANDRDIEMGVSSEIGAVLSLVAGANFIQERTIHMAA
jgi:hypothetical protein